MRSNTITNSITHVIGRIDHSVVGLGNVLRSILGLTFSRGRFMGWQQPCEPLHEYQYTSMRSWSLSSRRQFGKSVRLSWLKHSAPVAVMLPIPVAGDTAGGMPCADTTAGLEQVSAEAFRLARLR